MSTKKGIVLITLAIAIVAVGAGTPSANEPLLLVYPDQPAVFRYDPARYEVVTAPDPKYNAAFAISNAMLWDRVENRIPYEIYRAPHLVGFAPSPYGISEYALTRSDFNVIVDGFSAFTRTYRNLHIRFVPVPATSFVEIFLDSEFLPGLVTHLPDLDVTTAVGDGYYSDSMVRRVTWSGAAGLRIVVYSDKDNDGLYSGGKPLFSVYVEENTVSTEATSWGAVKARYRD